MVDCGNEAEYGRDDEWERTLKVDREMKWVSLKGLNNWYFLEMKVMSGDAWSLKKRYTIYYGLTAFNLLHSERISRPTCFSFQRLS